MKNPTAIVLLSVCVLSNITVCFSVSTPAWKDEFTDSITGSIKSKQLHPYFLVLTLCYYLECDDAIYGCLTCQEQTKTENGATAAKPFVVCSSCHLGLYLLSNSTSNSALFPKANSFCVSDCQKAHNSYINDRV
jgi:hypothetical protein